MFAELPNGQGFQCTLCKKICKHQTSIRTHQQISHYGMVRYQCEFCGWKNFIRSRIVCHILTVHAEEIKRRNIVYQTENTWLAERMEGRKRLVKSRTQPKVNMKGVILIETDYSNEDVAKYFTCECLY
jgi:hypothetical protein